MKRSEVTVQALKDMGYKAMYSMLSWDGSSVHDCNTMQSEELFTLVVQYARTGKKVDVVHDIIGHKVIVHVVSKSYRGVDFHYFLQRTMTDAEVMEGCLKLGIKIEYK